jgi:hypothetical protein
LAFGVEYSLRKKPGSRLEMLTKGTRGGELLGDGPGLELLFCEALPDLGVVVGTFAKFSSSPAVDEHAVDPGTGHGTAVKGRLKGGELVDACLSDLQFRKAEVPMLRSSRICEL